MSKLTIGYCTNVHAGDGLVEVQTNLDRYARRVQQLVSPEAPLGIGLWLSHDTVRQLTTDRLAQFREWLSDRQLVVYTCNGFPFASFHRDIVKHRVYRPTWWERDRHDYTLKLIAAMHDLAPPGDEVSISTLPVAWRDDGVTQESLRAAADQLVRIARSLSDLELATGRLMYVCLEPEPGCVLQSSDDVVAFFRDYLLSREAPELVRRYLRVCHDICHAYVMFESQIAVLDRYQAAGIKIGKAQISSAVGVDLSALAGQNRMVARDELQAFDERRYLHQTMVRRAGQTPAFYEDLPLALAVETWSAPAEWRVHFHVPVFLERLGRLQTGQRAILEFLDQWKTMDDPPPHFEVETYAWNVLPEPLQPTDLAIGIAGELQWLHQQCVTRSLLTEDAEGRMEA